MSALSTNPWSRIVLIGAACRRRGRACEGEIVSASVSAISTNRWSRMVLVGGLSAAFCCGRGCEILSLTFLSRSPENGCEILSLTSLSRSQENENGCEFLYLTSLSRSQENENGCVGRGQRCGAKRIVSGQNWSPCLTIEM